MTAGSARSPHDASWTLPRPVSARSATRSSDGCNNERVRAALKGAIDGFLTGMLVDEQLTDYQLEVTATRRDEIEGRAIVSALLQPTFSIDFVAVTLVLR